MKQFPSLNGLRAISITIVILYHLILFNFKGNLILQNFPVLDGQFGVNVFFVISGFLITSLLLQEEKDFGKISLKNFYARRTLRIFPAYFFMLLIYFILQLLGYLYIPQLTWITALTYTKYLNVREYYTDHAWSLSIEENFYLIWPIIFLMGKDLREYFVALLILIVPVIRIYLYFYPIDWITELSIFTRIDSIALGCYFALYNEEIRQKCELYWNKIFYVSLVALFILPWLVFLIAETYMGGIFISLGSSHGTLANILIGLIMMYSIYGPRKVWFRILNSKVFNYVGVLSYSIYLWQQIFVLKRTWWVTKFPQNILFIILAAAFSYYVIERPFLKLKSRFSSKKREGLIPLPPIDPASSPPSALPIPHASNPLSS